VHYYRSDLARARPSFPTRRSSDLGTLTKLDHAINAVLMLSHVSQAFQDNLGLLIFSHTVHRYLPPAKGRAQHAHFLQALYSVKRSEEHTSELQSRVDLVCRLLLEK